MKNWPRGYNCILVGKLGRASLRANDIPLKWPIYISRGRAVYTQEFISYNIATRVLNRTSIYQRGENDRLGT